jgi:hypothetical protein
MPDGVPTFEKFNTERRGAYLAALRSGKHRCTASRSVGVSHSLVCMYRNEHPEFAKEETAAEMEADGQVVDSLFTTALSGNVAAICAWLYNRRPDEWKDRRKFEHSGPGGGPIPMQLEAMTHDERRRRIEGLLVERERAGAALPSRNGNSPGPEVVPPGPNPNLE